jgi:hypothetical protein
MRGAASFLLLTMIGLSQLVEAQNRTVIAVSAALDIVEDLLSKFPDFRRAYNEGGLTIDEFDSFGATRRTLRQFISACHDLPAIIRDQMIPDDH